MYGFGYVKDFILFTDILTIDHLWEFTSLARLDLNNNLIEKIRGLDRLTNLTWLSKMKSLMYILLGLLAIMVHVLAKR